MNAKRLVWALVAVSMVGNLAIGLQHPLSTFWDEQFYGYAATLLLHGQGCPSISVTVGSSTVPLATSCNYEHPPLVKLMVAVALYLLTPLKDASASGTLPYLLSSFLSFRLVQLVLGALCLPLMYYIAEGISGDRRLAMTASILLLLEPLFAFFSRLDYLDIPMIFFALCAYAVYFTGRQPASTVRLALAGVFLGLSFLSKETGLVFIVPLLLYHLLFRDAPWWRRSEGALVIAGAGAAVSAAGLQLYDTLAATPFPTFASQVAYMVNYSDFLAGPHLCSALGPVPWYFLLTSNYWMLDVSYNPVLLFSVFVWIPAGTLLLWSSRKSVDGGSRLFVFACFLFAATFFQNEFLCAAGRILWVWYFLPLVPSLALGCAYLLTRTRVPRWSRVLLAVLIVVGYVAAYFIGPGLLLYD
jgi:4-amino-4-deoxy-L-arabinose transferase-like glycosyltransferase